MIPKSKAALKRAVFLYDSSQSEISFMALAKAA